MTRAGRAGLCTLLRSDKLTLELGCGHPVAENIELCRKRKLVKWHAVVLVTVCVTEFKVLNDVMGSSHSREDVRMIGKCPLWNKISKIGDVAHSAHAVDVEDESTSNGEGMEYGEFIEVESNRG